MNLYLKLLFARIGKTYSPVSGEIVKRDTLNDVVNWLNKNEDGTKTFLITTIYFEDRKPAKQLELLKQQGFTRLWLNNKVERIDKIDLKDLDKEKLERNNQKLDSSHLIVLCSELREYQHKVNLRIPKELRDYILPHNSEIPIHTWNAFCSEQSL